MSDTDIYKERETMPNSGVGSPKKKRHRRKSSKQPFDDRPRKRRSKNTGLRRLLHLSRKSDNEKYFWWSMGITFVVVLVLIAIWQFWIAESVIRSEEKKDDYVQDQSRIPSASDNSRSRRSSD